MKLRLKNIELIGYVCLHMAVDADKLLKKVRGEEPPKGRISLYFDLQLWKEFQKCCNGVSASKVMEELARQFIESAKKPK